MSSRGNAPSLAISGIPPDVLKRALDRAKADGWFSKNALFVELLRDYADGVITPKAPPPPFDPARRKPSDG